ncbi:hypothetical protein [Chryseobacterium sp. T1]
MNKLLFILSSVILSAQSNNVGINTITPRVTLDIKGDYYSDKIIVPNINAIPAEAKDRYNLLAYNITDNSIKVIDPTLENTPGIASIVTYKLENVRGDYVLDFNTLLNANDYALVVLSGYFDTDVEPSNNSGPRIALPSFGAKNTNGTWRLYADYPGLNAIKDNKNNIINGAWTIMCAVYPKTYVKIFQEQEIDMNQISTGTATNAILN